MSGARAAIVALALGSLALALGSLVPAARASGATPDPALAASWLARQQIAGGAFGDGQPADAVAETIASLVAGGVAGPPIERALKRIAADGPPRAEERAAYAARIVLGLHAAGRDPRAFHGTDYVALIERAQNPVTGELDDGMYSHAVAALGLAAARGSLPDGVVRYVRANECRDGGLGHERGCLGGPDTDTTAMTIAALRAAGIDPRDELLGRARGFLVRVQNPDGGFGLTPGAATNANSTGLTISALTALGEDVRARAWRRTGRPLDALAALQTDAGGFRYLAEQDEPNLYATVQAIPGAARATYPIEPRARVSKSMRRGPAVGTGRQERPATSVLGTSAHRPPATARSGPVGRVSGSIPDTSPRPRGGPIAAGVGILVVVGAAHALAWSRR